MISLNQSIATVVTTDNDSFTLPLLSRLNFLKYEQTVDTYKPVPGQCSPTDITRHEYVDGALPCQRIVKLSNQLRVRRHKY